MAKEYNIVKATGRCITCQKEMAPGEEFVATVREVQGTADDEEEFAREDYCPGCWQAASDETESNPHLLGVWRSRVPAARERKKTFVDDELLVNFFQRLDGAEEPAKVRFRFVLALILMRKKLLVYDRSETAPEGHDAWTMHFKGAEETCSVIDPHLDGEKITQVSQQLGEILEGEL